RDLALERRLAASVGEARDERGKIGADAWLGEAVELDAVSSRARPIVDVVELEQALEPRAEAIEVADELLDRRELLERLEHGALRAELPRLLDARLPGFARCAEVTLEQLDLAQRVPAHRAIEVVATQHLVGRGERAG